MKKVWKFKIPPQDEPIRLMLPIGARILRIADRHVWIEGLFGELEERETLFFTFGTGHAISNHLRHAGSYKDIDPVTDFEFIWHVYVYPEWLVT